MKHDFLYLRNLLIYLVILTIGSCQSQLSIPDVSEAETPKDLNVDSILHLCWKRLDTLRVLQAQEQTFPRSWDKKKGVTIADPPHVWTVGFYPGLAWKAYFHTGDSKWKEEAMRLFPLLGSQAGNTTTHDLGFMLFLGMGKGKASEEELTAKLNEAAKSLHSRFAPSIGAIKSYDTSYEDEFPVIIDNLINLELLVWAGSSQQDSHMISSVRAHADFTRKSLVREAESCATHHKVMLSKSNSSKYIHLAGQGAQANSVWSRGLAWGIYGYTMLGGYLKDSSYLNLAKCMANYWLDNIPEDGIPYWDFEASHIPNEPRDASAAAITASALLELVTFLPESEDKYDFFRAAEKILRSLCSPTYFLPQNVPFILDHSTLSMPDKIDVDRPQTMADYYFVEALQRYEAAKAIFSDSLGLNQVLHSSNY